MALAETGDTEQAFAVGGVAGAAKSETYVNEAGQTLHVPLVNGEPIVTIPMGFTKKEEMPSPVAAVEPVQQPAQTMAKGGLATKRKKK
jgi:hypothetical protein